MWNYRNYIRFGRYLDLKRLLKIFYIFAILGIQMFGNLVIMIPVFERELINKRSLITKNDLLDSITMGRCGPGAAVINTVAYLGNKIYGFLGGMIATIGFVFFPFIIIAFLSITLDNFANQGMLKNFFTGVLVCISILIVKSMIEFWKSTITDRITFIIFVITLVLSIFTKLPIYIYIISSGIIGIIMENIHIKRS